MSKVVLDTETITDIADAIRTKTGTTDGIKPNDMADKIDTIPGLPAKGFLLENYDSEGYPTTCRFVGTWEQTLPIFRWYFSTNSMYKKIKTITVPEGITILPLTCFYGCDTIETINLPNTLQQLIGTYTFYQCGVKSITLPASCTSFVSNQQFVQCKMTSFTHLGQMPDIPNSCFMNCSLCKLYDFSHCTTIPSLYSVSSIGHASGCVIKVPQALLADWQTATNWAALTDVVWQGV